MAWNVRKAFVYAMQHISLLKAFCYTVVLSSKGYIHGLPHNDRRRRQSSYNLVDTMLHFLPPVDQMKP